LWIDETRDGASETTRVGVCRRSSVAYRKAPGLRPPLAEVWTTRSTAVTPIIGATKTSITVTDICQIRNSAAEDCVSDSRMRGFDVARKPESANGAVTESGVTPISLLDDA
jgi:hypothetical protein